MTLQFKKYHGTGNDFILLDGRKNDIPPLKPASIERLCDRHFGIGADGLIILKDTSLAADFEMLYYNSDGLPGTMCGNGGRCIAAFARQLGIFKTQCTFMAADGTHTAEILENGWVKLSLNDVGTIQTLSDGYFLDTGSPHFVMIRDDVDRIDVVGEGRAMRHDKRFPDGTNVNFMQFVNDRIRVRTYERGVEDETLSCGTGVTASAIAANIHRPELKSPLAVETPGGNLSVTFTIGNHVSDVYLTGPAEMVFTGNVEIPIR